MVQRGQISGDLKYALDLVSLGPHKWNSVGVSKVERERL